VNVLKSMSGRIFLILIIGVFSSTALTWWLAYGERQRTLDNFRELRSLERAEQLLTALDALPTANREAFLSSAPRLGLRISSLPKDFSSDDTPHSPYAAALSERLGKRFKVDSLSQNSDVCRKLSQEARNTRINCEALVVTLHDGTALRLMVAPPRNSGQALQSDVLIDLLLFLVCIGTLAFIISRMTTRPLVQLARAATDLGLDINRPPLPEKGSKEILEATKAFNAMQAQIHQHIKQRTHMLAAITHDLQTPLTRLRLRLEKVEDETLRQKLIEDLSATQAMVKEGLDFARSMDSSEGLHAVDLNSMLDSICADAIDTGQDVEWETGANFTIMARPLALKRCLVNLIDNAVKYGFRAHISSNATEINGKHFVQIFIHDAGPGLPENQLQRVFEPFYRAESSRSRETGGTGLGLTIAQNIARQHGGDVLLSNLASGGLEVCLRLPLKT